MRKKLVELCKVMKIKKYTKFTNNDIIFVKFMVKYGLLP